MITQSQPSPAKCPTECPINVSNKKFIINIKQSTKYRITSAYAVCSSAQGELGMKC